VRLAQAVALAEGLSAGRLLPPAGNCLCNMPTEKKHTCMHLTSLTSGLPNGLPCFQQVREYVMLHSVTPPSVCGCLTSARPQPDLCTDPWEGVERCVIRQSVLC